MYEHSHFNPLSAKALSEKFVCLNSNASDIGVMSDIPDIGT